MRSHGITMIGTFTLEKVSVLPTFDATRDDGRLIYLLSTGECYLGADTEWVLIDKNSVILDDHENRITQDDNDIDWLNNELDDHIDSRDEHPVATQTENGFVSASDKAKLDGIESNADNYSLETHGDAYHTENYLTAVSTESLETLSDVGFSNLRSGDSLRYYTASWGRSGWTNEPVNFDIHKSLDSSRTISNLVGGAKYFIIIEYITPNKGTGHAGMFHPVLYDSSDNVIQYSSTDGSHIDSTYLARDYSIDIYYRQINWFDGNMSRTSTFLITAPSDGYIKTGPGCYQFDWPWGGTRTICYAMVSMLSIHALRIG